MRLVLAIVCALTVTSAEADVGIGVSAKTDTATVYIPITVKRFMLEPYFRAADQKVESSTTTGTTFPFTSVYESQLREHEVGVGVFRLVPLAERVTLYYGGRLASIDQKVTSSSSSSSGLNPPPPLSQPTETDTLKGHSIIAALGFHYNVMNRLSIGAEIGIDHTEADTGTINRSQTGMTTQTSTDKITTNQTRADVILRFLF
jgi:hypothetical protein